MSSEKLITDNVVALYRKGERFISFGEIDAAEEALLAALNVDNRFAPAWNLLGHVYRSTGQLERARECFTEAVHRSPDWIEPLMHLGLMEFGLERYEAARSALNAYMEGGGRDLDVLGCLAKAAFEIDDCKTVMRATSIIVEEDEERGEAWEMRGLCQARASKFNAACISLNMAIEISPGSIDAMNAVGDLCYEAANYIRAIDFYGPSLSVNMDQPRVLFRHGTSLWFLGQWNEAIPFLERYTILAPDDPKGWNNLGVAVRERGEVKRAMECYGRALNLNPDLEVVRHNMDTAKEKRAMV